ncbi:MAG TPA: hypothetical protein VGX78_11345 [Pirellulales bacterium]|jgi:hypothetical protein|nr:hypothetical protein [Pirellulales bacterium]
MNHHYQRTSRETITLVDQDGNVWSRLNCRGCLLKDRRKLRFPVWVPKGHGHGLCKHCQERHIEPLGLRIFNPNLLLGEIHLAQYEGANRWYSDDE